jgi:hypothetical protein
MKASAPEIRPAATKEAAAPFVPLDAGTPWELPSGLLKMPFTPFTSRSYYHARA